MSKYVGRLIQELQNMETKIKEVKVLNYTSHSIYTNPPIDVYFTIRNTGVNQHSCQCEQKDKGEHKAIDCRRR